MSIQTLQPFLAESYENFPKGRTVSVLVLRTTASETIFRTQGGTEPLSKAYTSSKNGPVERLVMTKRKQIAPERRTGRARLRNHNLLYAAPKSKELCGLNTNAPCGECIDCFLYGFAAGGNGSQPSRVWTEDAFSVLSASECVEERTINAPYESGTMSDETGETSSAISTSEGIKPGVHFLDIVALKDLTADELRYHLSNMLLTTRYGAVSSRAGRMDNQILGVFGGISELPSSLELVTEVTEQLSDVEHPLKEELLIAAIGEVIEPWVNRRGISVRLSESELKDLLDDLETCCRPNEQETFLQRLNNSYDSFR